MSYPSRFAKKGSNISVDRVNKNQQDCSIFIQPLDFIDLIIFFELKAFFFLSFQFTPVTNATKKAKLSGKLIRFENKWCEEKSCIMFKFKGNSECTYMIIIRMMFSQ